MPEIEGWVGEGHVQQLPTARAAILAQPGASTFDVALFADNLWWTTEQVAGLVGQRPMLTDERTEARAPYRITKAWKANGMVCVRLEPLEGDDD
jgi:hypothetical protein